MNNLIELNNEELNEINGGATFAYRVGQSIRYVGFLMLTKSNEFAYNMTFLFD